MRISSINRLSTLALITSLAILTIGCGKKADDAGAGDEQTQTSAASDEGDDHSGWWCAEHGVPEEDCSLCSADAAARFKEKGDWCEQHNRAESQCFECDASRADKFAKLYEAKFGHAPPKPTK